MGNPLGPEFGRPTPSAGLGAGIARSTPARRNRRDKRPLTDAPERRGAAPPITPFLIIAEVSSYFDDLRSSTVHGTYQGNNGVVRTVSVHREGKLYTMSDPKTQTSARLEERTDGGESKYALVKRVNDQRPEVIASVSPKGGELEAVVTIPSGDWLHYENGGPLDQTEVGTIGPIQGSAPVPLGNIKKDALAVLAKIFFK